MVGSVNSVATGNVYLNTSENVDVARTDSRQNIKDTQAYQTLVKLVGDGYKGVDGTKEDKAAVRKEAQQLLAQLHSGLGSSDNSTGNVITVAMPKASSLLTLLIAMIESENESSIAGYKMSGKLGVISQISPMLRQMNYVSRGYWLCHRVLLVVLLRWLLREWGRGRVS